MMYEGFIILPTMMEEEQPETVQSMTLPPLLDKEIEWINTHQYRHSTEYLAFLQLIEENKKPPQEDQEEPTLTSKFQQFVTFLFSSVKDSLTLHTEELNEARLHSTELSAQLQAATERIESLNDEIDILKKKNTDWEEEYESSKAEQAQMQERYENNLRELKKEKKQIKQTFIEVQENTEIERQLLENLQIEKEEMDDKMVEEKKEKEHLLEELAVYREQVTESEKKLAASTTKLTWESKRIEQLEQELIDKDKAIQQLRDQLYPPQQLIPDVPVDRRKTDDEKVNTAKHRSSFIAGVKLSQQMIHLSDEADFLEHRDSIILNIPFKEDHAKASYHSRPEQGRKGSVEVEEYISPSIQQESEDQEPLPVTVEVVSPTLPPPPEKVLQPQFAGYSEEVLPVVREAKLEVDPKKDDCPQTHPTEEEEDLGRRINSAPVPVPDFYYAHYLLITQSVKMQLNRQDYYERDMRPLYRQLLRDTVPMHQWAQWVERRLERG